MGRVNLRAGGPSDASSRVSKYILRELAGMVRSVRYGSVSFEPKRTLPRWALAGDRNCSEPDPPPHKKLMPEVEMFLGFRS